MPTKAFPTSNVASVQLNDHQRHLPIWQTTNLAIARSRKRPVAGRATEPHAKNPELGFATRLPLEPTQLPPIQPRLLQAFSRTLAK